MTEEKNLTDAEKVPMLLEAIFFGGPKPQMSGKEDYAGMREHYESQFVKFPGMKPDYYALKRYNFADKWKRMKALNNKEKRDLSDICEHGENQIVFCYRELNKDVSPEDVKIMCSGCQYAKYQKLYGRSYADNIWEPFWVKRWFEYEGKEFEDAGNVFVYLITDGRFVKIGIAKNLKKRITTLQISTPDKLDLICSIPCKGELQARKLEHYLHDIYRNYRLNGEWFDIRSRIRIDTWKIYFNDLDDELEVD